MANDIKSGNRGHSNLTIDVSGGREPTYQNGKTSGDARSLSHEKLSNGSINECKAYYPENNTTYGFDSEVHAHNESNPQFNITVMFNATEYEIPMSVYDTISILKDKTLIAGSGERKDHPFYGVFLVRWTTTILSGSSSSHVSKRLIETSYACELILREENSWPGRVIILVASLVTSKISNSIALQPNQPNQRGQNADTAVTNLPSYASGLTDWIYMPTVFQQCDYSIKGPGCGINELIFTLISNTCLKQGVLLRKAVINGVERWKPQYFLLTPNNLWYFNINTAKG